MQEPASGLAKLWSRRAQRDTERWARGAADDFARRVGRLHDHNWATVLRLMLERTAMSPPSVPALAVLIHVLAPAGAAPSPVPVYLVALDGSETPQELGRQVVESNQGHELQPSTNERVLLSSSVEAVVLTSRVRVAGEMRAAVRVLWAPTPRTVLALSAVGDGVDGDRVLAMKDDLATLAGSVRLDA